VVAVPVVVVVPVVAVVAAAVVVVAVLAVLGVALLGGGLVRLLAGLLRVTAATLARVLARLCPGRLGLALAGFAGVRVLAGVAGLGVLPGFAGLRALAGVLIARLFLLALLVAVAGLRRVGAAPTVLTRSRRFLRLVRCRERGGRCAQDEHCSEERREQRAPEALRHGSHLSSMGLAVNPSP
jgi:hypothetical protein